MMKKIILAMAIALMMAACGSKFEGIYSNGAMTYEFKSNGTLATKQMGTRVEIPYQIEGDTIKFQYPGGNNVVKLKKEADGSLTHPAFGKFVKR